MSVFPAISVSATGVNVDQTWLDAIATNVANVNDQVTPGQQVFQPQQLEVAPSGSGFALPGVANSTGNTVGQGVQITGVTTYSPNGISVYDPTNPLANKAGIVTQAGVDLPGELGNMINAERSYQANVSVINHAKAAYQSVISIGA